MKRVDLWPKLLSCQQIDQVDWQLAQALSIDVKQNCSLGLVTCDQDDSMYVALDHATKFANVEVRFAKSFYAGSRHASGPYSGEILGILSAENPDEIAEGLWALRQALREVRFQTFEGPAETHPAFLAHVVTETGRYLAPQAEIQPGEPMAYLIAPPMEAVLATDAALKAAPVKLAKWIPPPSETNFAGAFLTGALPDLQAARDAFVDCIAQFVQSPLAAARRPERMRR